jgi:hypothetical protein
VTTLDFFDLDSRELLRTRPNPLADEVPRLRGAVPPGHHRTIDRTGAREATGQRHGHHRDRPTTGRARPGHAGRTLTVAVTDTKITVDCDHDLRTLPRTTDLPIRNHKANWPHRLERRTCGRVCQLKPASRRQHMVAP